MENKSSYPQIAFKRNLEDVMFHLAAALCFCNNEADSKFLADTFQSLVSLIDKMNARNEKSSK